MPQYMKPFEEKISSLVTPLHKMALSKILKVAFICLNVTTKVLKDIIGNSEVFKMWKWAIVNILFIHIQQDL